MIIWIVWYLVGVALAAVFAVAVLPALFFWMLSALFPVRDRGLGKYNLRGGVSVLYEPSLPAREFIAQYQLCRSNSARSCRFIGEWAQPVFCGRYEVIAYNSKGRIIGIFRVEESSCGAQFTRPLALPEGTDCVSVIFTRANGKKFARGGTFCAAFFARFALFLLALAAAAVALFAFTLLFVFLLFGQRRARRLGMVVWAVCGGAVRCGGMYCWAASFARDGGRLYKKIICVYKYAVESAGQCRRAGGRFAEKPLGAGRRGNL